MGFFLTMKLSKYHLLISLLPFIFDHAYAEQHTAEQKMRQRSMAHKQFEFVDPQESGEWTSQFNAEVDRYQYADYLYSSVTTSVNNWSFQVGEQNAPLSASDATVPFVYAGITKQLDLNELFNITIGAQAGSYTNSFTFLNFDYATFGINKQDYTLAIGPYYGNKEITETFAKIGYIIVWNYNIFDFSINGNYISGNNNMSGLAINVGYNINRYLQPYIGFGDTAQKIACDQCTQYYYMALGLNVNF